MFTNEKYLKFTAPGGFGGFRFFIRVNDVITIKVTSKQRIEIVYAQAEHTSQGWNLNTTSVAEANAAASDLMAQIIALQATPYTESVRNLSENGYKITGQ